MCLGVYRHDIRMEYDKWAPAKIVFIGSTVAVRGAVNCFPRLLEAQTVVDGLPQKTSQIEP